MEKTPAQTELDEQAAVVARSQASVDTAAAQIQTAQAELETAQTDLTKAYISSPIDGVVLARSVEPGYAVAASLQAVELLTLASDLKTLDLEIDVDEADVSVVKPGQKATFTVSAYPNKNFPATLTKVAYGPTESETNVVTYTAYLKVTNNELLLRPGMTATARIVTEQRQNALLVPNTALRFAPSVSKGPGSAVDTLMMGPPRSSNKVSKEVGGVTTQRKNTVWVLRSGSAQEIDIITGASDGTYTEVISGDLKEGDLVITSQLRSS